VFGFGLSDFQNIKEMTTFIPVRREVTTLLSQATWHFEEQHLGLVQEMAGVDGYFLRNSVSEWGTNQI